jgi:hypothetical protein
MTMRTKLVALSIAGVVGVACGSGGGDGSYATSQPEALGTTCNADEYYGGGESGGNPGEMQDCSGDGVGSSNCLCGTVCTWDMGKAEAPSAILPLDIPLLCESPCATTADCLDPMTSCQFLPAIPADGSLRPAIPGKLSCALTDCSVAAGGPGPGKICDANGPGSQDGTCVVFPQFPNVDFPNPPEIDACSLGGTAQLGEACSGVAFRSQSTELCAPGLVCNGKAGGSGTCILPAGAGGSGGSGGAGGSGGSGGGGGSGQVSAQFTANGATSLTVPVGTSVRYSWSATGAVSASSTYTIDSPACGSGGTGPFAWVAHSLSGSTSGRAASCQAGHTYWITYKVTGADGETASATDSIYIP